AQSWPRGARDPRRTRARAPRCRERHSRRGAQVRQIAFRPQLLEHRIRGRGGKGLSATEDPDPLLLRQWSGAADGTESQFIASLFQFQHIPWLQSQGLAQRLGDDNAAGLIEGEARRHRGILLWVDPLASTIISRI